MSTAILGAQRATTRNVPTGRGDDSAVMLAKALGYKLLPWQSEVLTLSACTDRSGLWKAFENVIIAPRQQGKSFVVIPRVLAGALVYGERLIVYSAHENKTAQETWLLMREACQSDLIAPYVRQIRHASGSESVWFTNGSRFLLRSRTRTAGRGLSPDTLLLDEAFAITGDMVSALLPSMAARVNPQIYYLSSAGTWQSEILLQLRKRGHARTSPRMAYWEWHADPTDDVRDERVWARANPSYGVLSTKESVLRELESMSLRAFQRERLGIWSESFAETTMSEEDIHAVVVDVPLPPRDGRPMAWGVDVATDRSTAAVSACFRNDDGTPTVVLVESRPGAGWLPQRLGELAASYANEGFAYDHRGGIIDLMDRARREFDVETLPLKFSEYPAACAGFTQSVADRSVRIGRAPELVADAVNATARMVSTGWVFDRKVTTSPIRLISATCALYALDHGNGAQSVAVY
jgi:hypothetical protein